MTLPVTCPVLVSGGSHGNPRWSPDGTRLYFSGDLIPDEGYERGNSEVHAIDLATLEITTLTDRLGPDNGPIPSRDGSRIAYTGYDQNDNYSNLSNLYLMDADGGNTRMLAGNPDAPRRLVLFHALTSPRPSDMWRRRGAGPTERRSPQGQDASTIPRELSPLPGAPWSSPSPPSYGPRTASWPSPTSLLVGDV